MAVTQQLQNLMREQASKKPSQQTRLQSGNTSFGKTDMSSGKLPTRGVSTLKPTGGTTGIKKTGTSGSSARSRPKTSASNRHQDELHYEGMNYRPRIQSAPKKPGFFSHLINGLGALFFLTLALGIAWKGTQPESFDLFWQQKVVPVLPQQVRQFVK